VSEFSVLGEILGFSGLNTEIGRTLLPEEGSPIWLEDGNNIIIRNGLVEKIRGTDYLNGITTQQGIEDFRSILALPIFEKYSTDDKFLMAVTPKRLYVLINNDEWDEIGTIADGKNDSILTHANAYNMFIFTLSDSGILYSWDGTNETGFYELGLAAQDVTTLKARFIEDWDTFLVLARTLETVDDEETEYYQRLWISDPGNITNFRSINKIDIAVEGKIVGIKSMQDTIVVYFPRGIYRVYYNDTMGYLPQLVTDRQGLLCPGTLCGNKDVHYFISQEGLMQMVRDGVPTSISDGKFNNLIMDEMDPIYYYRATAFLFPHLNQLFLCYPKSGSSFNNVQIIYDVSRNELISKKELVAENYSCYGEFEKDLSTLSPDERKAYGLSFIPIFGNKDGYIKEQKIVAYTDGVSNYESNILFPPTFWKDKTRNKRVLAADLLIEKMTDETITFSLDLASELNQSFSFQYSITGNGNAGIRRYSIPIDCFGKEFTVRLRDTNNCYGWRCHGCLFYGWLRGRK
jgi:hypothetical protein